MSRTIRGRNSKHIARICEQEERAFQLSHGFEEGASELIPQSKPEAYVEPDTSEDMSGLKGLVKPGPEKAPAKKKAAPKKKAPAKKKVT